MRNPFDLCVLPGCPGVLMIAKRQLPKPIYSNGGMMCPTPQHNEPIFVLDYLSCTQCGLVYRAADAGKDIEMLRARDWMHHGCEMKIDELPKDCKYCGYQKLTLQNNINH